MKHRIFVIIGIIFVVLGLLIFAATGKLPGLFVLAIGIYEICVGVKRGKEAKNAAADPVPASETNPVQKASKPKAVEDDEEDNGENIRVAGVSFRQDAIKSFAEENPEYDLTEEEIVQKGLADKPIYEYTFPVLPATFQFEPENQYDPNAIAIYVEGVQIGYVKKGSTSHIRKLIENDRIIRADCTFRGGNSKVYYKDTEDLEEIDGEFSAKIHLVLKDSET